MCTKSLLSTLFLLIIGLLGRSADAQDQYSLTVTAGGFDRTETVVSVVFPKRVASGVYRLRDSDGDTTLMQVDQHNRGWFVVEHLAAGASETYDFAPETSGSRPAGVGPGISYSAEDRTFTFQKKGQPVFAYYYRENDPPEKLGDRYRRAGYLHPVFSPGGVSLTNHLDTRMHPHHYGIWSAWTHTEFQGRTPDFWNVQDRTGRVEHADSVEAIWEGPVLGGLKAKNHFTDLTASAPVIALNEQWELRVYNVSGSAGQAYHLFDLKVTHTTNTGQPLRLPEYHYGGLAFRGHQQWDNPEKISFLTSRGYNRSNGNETRARWVHIGGQVDGRQAGVAILGHPDNFRAPQPVRIHPEIPYMVFAPMQLGEMAISPASPYVMRYRFVTYDGEPDEAKLDRLWNDFAYPPGVTVKAQ